MKREMKNNSIKHKEQINSCYVTKGTHVLRTFLFLMLMMMGVSGMWGQHPFTLTNTTDVTNGTETLYWIESKDAAGFYMIPMGTSNNSGVSTSNMPNEKMLWYFMDAGIESSTQYYYIVNNSTGYYLCHTGNLGDNNTIKIVSKTDENDASCKFSITGSSGQWLFSPKSGSTYYVNKKGSNVNYSNGLKSSTSADANSKWNFVEQNSVTWAHPFTNSTNSEKHYYNIHNATSNGAAYYMSIDDNSDPYATISNVDNRKRIWYFVEAASDNTIPNLKYYYIVNAVTGKYLKFTGTANGNVQAESLRLYEHNGTETGNTEERFRFMVLNAKGKTYSAYSIMPKLEISYYNNKKASLSPGDDSGNTYNAITLGNDMKIGIYNDRGQDNNYAHWLFVETDYVAVEAPTITNNFDGTISLSTTTPGATIYYTTNGDTPDNTSTAYSSAFSMGDATVIKAITYLGSESSAVTTYEIPQCAKPSITISRGMVTITCATEEVTIHYTTNGNPATSSSTTYTAPFAKGGATMIRAIATKLGYINSSEASLLPPSEVSSSSQITDMNGKYILASNFTSSGSIGTSDNPFTGTIDGNLNPLTLSYPLVAYASGATIKNVILDNVSISGGTNVGAICNEATGDSRIYNCGVLASNSTVEKDEDGYDKITSCSSTISGSNYVGSIVGLLDGSSRVINCFSYANVSGGSEVGGIVGHNNVATTATNLKTMVMNCMFYGEVSGSSIAPIYNGEIITNVDENTGVSNFNYFRLEASYIQNTTITKVYNCALGAETRFLQRFEFFRHLLNSNRELAAWWATGDAANKDDIMKWVMEPTQIGTSTPYPVLKSPGRYASVVNYTPNETLYDEANRNKGRKLGTLAVTIQNGTGGAGGASITTPSLSLTITDKDFEHFNFNYGKVQLPYYNDVGTNNYTDGKVVTGWKIVSITGGTSGSYSTGDDVTYTEGELTKTPYNFADRKCTKKDLYGTGGANRVFSQGAYWDVPEGVTAITIQPYWGKAVYLADAYYDVVYNTDMTTAYPVTTVGGGQHYNNGESIFNSQLVYTSMANAVSALSPSGTVYDNAVVLVGNYHEYSGIGQTIRSGKPYTITSVDFDGDNEPDYSFMWRFDGRTKLHPVRYDFLNVIGLGMAQKSTGGTGSYNFGIPHPLDWFEVTNTALFRVTQFEYSPANRVKKPIILQGGVIEQWVTQQQNAGDRVSYFHVGGNVWFKEFHRGSHQDNKEKNTPHPPVSVTGGDFNKFYLTGLYQSQASIYDDNAECYINGGRFGEVAGAGMEGIGTSDGKGNITWVIDHADMKEFYGGGINFAKPAHGNIHTIISNSYVDQFCGGPKFGDMESGRTVITTATDCTFGTYFGAGFGGNSYNRYPLTNRNNVINLPGPGKVNNVQKDNLNSWNDWVADEYTQSYNATYGGVSTQIDYQFIPMSSNVDNVARLWVEFVNFSLATCHNVTSTLTGCTITNNFYGGGSLGKVDGNVTSTLTNCKVTGNVYGAGFSASLPTVEVMNLGGFPTEPYYYTDLGTYRTAVFPATVTYKWLPGDDISIDKGNHILYTNADLSSLGTVTGNTALTINNTTVGESVYGGGEESAVNGNTTVTVNSGTIGVQGKGGYRWGNVYGGGKGKIVSDTLDVKTIDDADAGLVKGNTTVTINGTPETTKIMHNVYGGGAVGSVGTFTRDSNGFPDSFTENTGLATVTINGGTIGHERKDTGMVNGASRGWEGNPEGSFLDQLAWVNNTIVTIGDSVADEEDKGPTIKGSVYGGGENGHNHENSTVTINRGTIGNANAVDYECGNIYGAGCGTDTFWVDADEDGEKDDDEIHHNPMAGLVRGTSTIVMKGGNVLRNIYGGGSMGSVGGSTHITNQGKTTITIQGGQIGTGNDQYGNVFGGSKGNIEDTQVIASVRTTQVDIKTGADVKGSVFGGGEAGIVKEAVVVNMTGGKVLNDVYGGGALANTNTSVLSDNASPVTVNTTVNLHGGSIGRNVYGGGLGQMAVGTEGEDDYEAPVEAKVYGDVLVALNGSLKTDENNKETWPDSCVVKGNVFGCNNFNGSPQRAVTVHVYKTVGYEGHRRTVPAKLDSDKDSDHSYELAAVYGGGNLAAFAPDEKSVADTVQARVIIDGCDSTSIRQVYGGGNAASTPATNVTINGTYEVEEVFGGGNGKDKITVNGVTKDNPGANVGFYDYSAEEDTYDTKEKRQTSAFTSKYVYGSGKASVNIFGGTIHRVFGGSNTKGNVRQTAVTMLEDAGGCEFCVDEAYGGGKSAPMDAEAKLLMACIPGLKAAYGGAQEADIQGNVTLNITNGSFDHVFGGNNISGTIRGSITLNIEETGCRPLIIQELYGGGNHAPYSVYGYREETKTVTDEETGDETEVTEWVPVKPTDENAPDSPLYSDPQVNVKSCTRIGVVYGGGLGEEAVMVGNPHVNINQVPGKYAAEIDVDGDGNADNIATQLGVIGSVFGGGNAAEVVGDTFVDIGTSRTIDFVTEDADSSDPQPRTGVTVQGANITGDVFGGGNNAKVTGNTHVQIGE